MKQPVVSVIAAVFNGQPYLREAIESILGQSFADFEFIVVNDGSTDGTADVLDDCAAGDRRVHLLANRTNIGLAASLNRALQNARGRYVARQDADDVSLPHRLADQVRFLKSNQHVGLLGTAYHHIDEHGQRTATHRQPACDTLIRWQMLFHNAFCHSSVMVRRSVLSNEPTGYLEHLRVAQDYDLWSRLLRHTKGANLSEPAQLRRVHPQSATLAHGEPQQRISCQIARAELRHLLPDMKISLDEVCRMRHWFYHTGDDALLESSADSPLIRDKLNAVLNAFVSLPGLNPNDTQTIVKRFGSRLGPQSASETSECSLPAGGQAR